VQRTSAVVPEGQQFSLKREAEVFGLETNRHFAARIYFPA
jgi:hypothetical protein